VKSENMKNAKSVMAFNSPSTSDEQMVGFCSSFEVSLGLSLIVWSCERSKHSYAAVSYPYLCT